MLGVEPQVIADYVATGRVKIVFWPVLNHGNPSIYSTLTAECAGRQDPSLFWAAHDALFRRQEALTAAGRDFYAGLAESIGADRAAFEQCFDDSSALDQVLALDDIRRQRGIVGQPIFDIGGQVLAGLPDYVILQTALDTALQTSEN